MIYNTPSGVSHELGPEESWTPLALNETRGILLVRVLVDEGVQPSSERYEIALAARLEF